MSPWYAWLDRIECKETEDSTGADEVYIDATWAGGSKRQVMRVTPMDEGDPGMMEVPIQRYLDFTNTSVTVKVWDDDTRFEDDDLLGEVLINNRYVDASKEVWYEHHFTEDGAHYILHFSVHQQPDTVTGALTAGTSTGSKPGGGGPVNTDERVR